MKNPNDLFAIGFDAGEHAGAYHLSLKILVILDAIRRIEGEDSLLHEALLLQVIRDVITPNLPNRNTGVA